MAYVDTCLLSLLTLRTIFGVLIDTSERLEMLLSGKNKYLLCGKYRVFRIKWTALSFCTTAKEEAFGSH